MDKKAALNSLEKIANILDIEKLHKEADTVTKIMIKIASETAQNSTAAKTWWRNRPSLST